MLRTPENFLRSCSLDSSPSHGPLRGISGASAGSWARLTSGASLGDAEQSREFRRGFSEDDLAVACEQIFRSMEMERLPLFELLCGLGHTEMEARVMETQLLPLLPSTKDGTVSCQELLKFLAGSAKDEALLRLASGGAP
ncbi:unnamed protein product [Durusdinium trenchii]|uniref:EF-hand domain-containing protein n=2 Tax=Durusdinium trenchii TaxID=1381693 RepID=A0ABP0NDU9_9DINO